VNFEARAPEDTEFDEAAEDEDVMVPLEKESHHRKGAKAQSD
jgi:hypothetical protein